MIIITLLIIIESLLYVRSEVQKDIFWIGSSPILRIQSQSTCDISKGVEKIVSLENQLQNTILVYCRDCGLSAISIEQNKVSSIKNYGKEIQIQQMVLQPNTTNLWVADKEYIYLFDVSQPQKNITKLSQIKKENKAGVTMKINFSESQKRLIVVNKSIVHLYDITDFKKFKYISAINGEWETYGAIISEKLNLIFLADGEYKVIGIKNKEDVNKTSIPIQYDVLCRFDLYYSEFNEIIDNKYIISKGTLYKLIGMNLSKFIKSRNCTDIKPQPFYQLKGSIIKLMITQDKKFIINMVSFLAIQILELEYGEQITSKLFQEIEIKSYLLFLSLSFDQQKIIISSEKSIDFYIRTDPNYQKINPSLLNLPQSIGYENFTQHEEQGWQCSYAVTKKLLFYAKGDEGLYVFKENEKSKFLEVQYLFTYNYFGYLEYVYAFNNDTNLIVGRDNFIFFYNIEDIQNPKLLSKTNFNNNNTSLDSGYITRDLKYIVLSADTEGILIADISDLRNPFQVSLIYHDYPESTPCVSLSVSQDENYAYASYKNQGLVIYDIKDKKKPKILSYLYTFGGESTTLMKNKNVILMSDRQNGLNIVDVSDLTKPRIISNTRIEGYMRKAVLVQNEEFALGVTRNRGQLVLIDIRDLKNPIILQKYEYKNFIGGLDICLIESQKVAYLSLDNAIVRLTLYPEWQFNTDIYIITEGDKAKNVLVDKSQIFLLGMNIKIKILQVYKNMNITLDGVKFYHQYKIQLLPSWAFYSESEQSLTLRLDKYALINSNDYSDDEVQDFTDKVVIQQFIFEIKDKLNKHDFISEDFKIDEQLSETIFLDCLNQSIVDDEYLVQQQSQDIIYSLFKQQSYSQEIVQYIIKILKNKILFYPIAIKIQSSLRANFEEDQIPHIESVSSKIQIQISVDKSQAEFIETTYQGLLVYFNDKSDQLKVEGDKSQINLFLEKGIKIANFCDPSLIEITMTINDDINFPLVKTFYANHKYLIYLNKPIEINKEKSLQSDFNRKFTNSVIYILESFTYTFSSDIFVDQDSSIIIYEAKIQIDGEYKPIPESFWLSFQSKERQFFGTTTTEMYLDNIRIMINATDGFSSVQDYFVIKVNGIPIRVILITITQILGPIIGLVGLWKYKQILYNSMYQKYYITTNMKVYSGQEIQLQIPLLENQLKIAQNIWKNYFKDQDKLSILTEMNYIKMMHSPYSRINGQAINPQDSNDSQLSLYTSSEFRTVNQNQLQVPNEQIRKSQDDPKRIFNDVQKSIFFDDQKKTVEDQKSKTLLSDQKLNLTDDTKNPQNDSKIQVKRLNDKHNTLQIKNQKRIQIDDQQSINQHINQQIRSTDNFRKSSDDQKELFVNELKKQELQDLQTQQENQKRITKFKQRMVKNLTSKIIGYENKVKKSFSKSKPPLQEQVNSFKSKYFLSCGRINREFIISDVLDYYQRKTKSKEDFILDNLLNHKSKLSNIICGLAAISFSKLEKSTFQAVQYLKKIAQQHGYMSTDWYKYYVIIKPQFDKVLVDQFPQLIFESDILIQELSVLYKSILHQNKEMKLILPFIKEVVSAYVYGFTPEKGGYVPSMRGESLEAKSHQIQSIRAYRPIRKKRLCLSKNSRETLVEKELSMNQIIPSWIQSIDISNEVILIKGKTENKDVGEHILKIFDKNNFILKQIRIIIFPKKDENLVTFYMEEDKMISFDQDDRDSVSMNETPVDASCFPNSIQYTNNYSTQCKTIQQIDKQSQLNHIQQYINN